MTRATLPQAVPKFRASIQRPATSALADPEEVSPMVGGIAVNPAVERNRILRGASLMKSHPKIGSMAKMGGME
jgi:hypothetical protein